MNEWNVYTWSWGVKRALRACVCFDWVLPCWLASVVGVQCSQTVDVASTVYISVCRMEVDFGYRYFLASVYIDIYRTYRVRGKRYFVLNLSNRLGMRYADHQREFTGVILKRKTTKGFLKNVIFQEDLFTHDVAHGRAAM